MYRSVMARGAYVETDALKGLRQLVAFAEDDQGDPLALSRLGRAYVARPAWPALAKLRPPQRARLRHDLRALLQTAAGGTVAGYLQILALHPELVPLVGQVKAGRLW